MLFCPHTVSQDNGASCFLTDEAECVISGRMSNKSLEMEPALLIRQQASAVWSCKLTQGVTDFRLVQQDGKTHRKIPNALEARLIAECAVDVVCP